MTDRLRIGVALRSDRSTARGSAPGLIAPRIATTLGTPTG